MANLINRVMNGGIYKVPTRGKRKPELSPSEIPTFKDYTSRLVDAEYAKECALEGMARTQVIWLKEGLVKA